MSVESIVIQVVQILAAISWTVLIFIQSRQTYPKASISHRIWHRPIDDSRILLRLFVTIENKGKVLLKLTEGFARTIQIFPFPDGFVNEVQANHDPISVEKPKYDWPEIQTRRTFDPIEIEPGECGEIQFDFIISASYQNISIYSHFGNLRKARKNIGWNTTTDYDLKKSNNPMIDGGKMNINLKKEGETS